MSNEIRELFWFKSSYSGGEGGACVEVAMDWRKSSYSSGAGGECVDVAACPGNIHVRDSKNTTGPNITFPARAWAEFVEFTASASANA